MVVNIGESPCSRRRASSTYSLLSSQPMALRCSRSATSRVVPAPAKGSSTVHGCGSPVCEQDGRQPVVSTDTYIDARCGLDEARIDGECPRTPLLFGWALQDSDLVSLTHGAAHVGQQPFSDVPALI